MSRTPYRYNRLTIHNWDKLYHLTFDNPIRDGQGMEWLVTTAVLQNNTAHPNDETYEIPMIHSPLQYYQVFVIYRTGTHISHLPSLVGDPPKSGGEWLYETGWKGEPPSGWLSDAILQHPDDLLLHIELMLHPSTRKNGTLPPLTPF